MVLKRLKRLVIGGAALAALALGGSATAGAATGSSNGSSSTMATPQGSGSGARAPAHAPLSMRPQLPDGSIPDRSRAVRQTPRAPGGSVVRQRRSVNCEAPLTGPPEESDSHVLPQTHQVHRDRRHGHRNWGRRLRHRRRNRQHQLRHRDDRFVHLGDISATPPRRGRIERSVWAGGRRIIGHGRARVRIELRNFDISRSEGDRQEDVIYEVPEGDKLELGGCH